jgi:MoaA/NifB/PqqE/SkfB family radical SAM enzyme
MPFCHSPWSNIDISPQGTLSPCCKFIHLVEPLNIKKNTIDEYSRTKVLKETKECFDRGEWPAGCTRCRIEEENGIQSKRILDFNRWQEHYNNYKFKSKNFITASIAFGNTCNLTCITCNPRSSSLWHREYQDIYNIDIKPNHFYKNNFVDEFIESTPDLIHLDIPGGEPFLSGIKEQKDMLLNYIKNKQAQNISIHYTTNATIFPENDWWDLWKEFRHVDIQLSLDGIGNRSEYIRYPSSWNNVLNNVHKYICILPTKSNLQISVSHTVSAYNIYYLDEFFTWCSNIGLPKPWLGKVHNPVYMRPTIWNVSARKYIVEHLLTSQYSDVHTWAQMIEQIDDSNQFEEFLIRTKQHDQYRNLSFAQTFPEMAQWI